MKYIFFLFSIMATQASASTYYFSSSSGYYSNQITPTQAQNINTPYRGNLYTLDSVLSGLFPISVKPGDRFLMKSGDKFTGSLTPTVSGTLGNEIFIGTYGGAARAVFSTRVQVTSWTNLGGNKYESNALGLASMPGAVFVDDQVQQIGRWPNSSTTGNFGYLQYDASTSTSITDNDWGTTTKPTSDWTGGQVAFRQNRFRFNVYDVNQTVSGNAITFNLPENQISTVNKFGYFLQNLPPALDLNGEWCYNKTTTKLTVFLIDPPSTHVIEATTKDRILDMGSSNYYYIQNISFDGSNQYGIYKANGSGLTIDGCDVRFNKNTGIYTTGVSGLMIKNSNIDSNFTFNLKLFNYSGDTATVIDNNISNALPFVGMNVTAGGQGTGAYMFGPSFYFQYNKIVNSAYNGAEAENGSNVTVKNNIISSANKWFSDGGSFYTNQQCLDSSTRNKVFDGNIIINSRQVTNSQGTFLTEGMTMAIYLDQWSNHWTISNNTVIDARCGIYANSPFWNSFLNNTIYQWGGDNPSAIEFTSWKSVPGSTTYSFCNNNSGATYTHFNIHDNVLSGNLVFSTASSGGTSVEYFSRTSPTALQPNNFGNFNNNKFIAPLLATTASLFKGQTIVSGGATTTTSYQLGAWNSTMGYEKNSTLSPKYYASGTAPSTPTQILYNDTKASKRFTLSNFNWINAADGSSLNTNEVYIPPYSSIAMIKNGAYVGTVTNVNPTISLTSPANGYSTDEPANVPLQATAADSDGSVNKVEFYNGIQFLGTGSLSGTTNTYSMTWSSVPAGTYDIKAVVTDNLGAVTNSTVNRIIINRVFVTAPSQSGQRIKVKYSRIKSN